MLVLMLAINYSMFYLTQVDNSKLRLNANYETFSYSFSFPEPSFNEKILNNKTYTTLDMSGCMSIGRKAGKPVLPVKYVKLLLPPGKKVIDIGIVGTPTEIKTDNVKLVNKPVFPHQTPAPIGSRHPKEVNFDEELYRSQSVYPSMPKEDQQIGYCRGYTVLSLAINPVQYVPGKGKLLYYPEMTLNIKLGENDYLNKFLRDSLDDEEWIKTLVNNPEITEYYDGVYSMGTLPALDYSSGLCDPSDSYDYVIITTSAGGLNDWATSSSLPYNWTSLMDKHALDDGLNCNLILVDDIVSCSDYWNETALFNDTAAKIREFCKDAYQDWGTSYILIGGDDDIIPAREMDYAYESDVDSDIYWNHLDNTFNADQDSEWGESGDDGFDLYSEMYIGRLTCDEPQDVSNWMNKSFYYSDSTFNDYLDNAAFYAGDSTWLCEGDDFIDYGAIKGTDDWLGPDPDYDGPYPSWLGFQYGFETWNSENPTKQFNLSVKWTAEPPNAGWVGGSEAAAITGLKNAINSDNVTLLSGIAHADATSSLDVTCSSWESNYHNTKPFFLHDCGCHSGDMDAADDGVLHSMLFHSDTELAFACVYNTGYGWGNGYTTNSSSSLQQKCFWDYFFDTTNNSGSCLNWQLGKAMAYSRDTMAPTINWNPLYESWRAIIQGCLLFGDPAQRLRAGSDNPIVLNNESPTNQTTNISTGSIILSVNVTDPESNSMNITFRTNVSGNWQDIGTNNSQQNGICYQTYEFNNFSTKYWWSVNAADITGSSGWTNETYHFTTMERYLPANPESFSTTAHNRTQINLTWIKGEKADKTYIEWNNIESWARCSGNNIYNGTETSYHHINLSFATQYYYQAWSWNDTNNTWSENNASSNATTDYNIIPLLNNESPTNGTVNVDKNYAAVNVTISDANGDSFNWTIQGLYVTDTGLNGETGGSKFANLITPLPYDTDIVWFVNVTDGYSWTNATYNFTVRSEYVPSLPSGFTATAYNLTQINLNWTNTGLNNTYIEWNNTDSWARDKGALLYNGTNINVNHSDLSCDTTVYYQAWSWNGTDNVWSVSNVSKNATTSNSVPVLTGASPSNGSTDQQCMPKCNITITDFNADLLTVYFYGNTSGSWILQQTNNSLTSGTNVIWNEFTNASSYSTVYYWSVNVTDGYSWTNRTYYFTTESYSRGGDDDDVADDDDDNGLNIPPVISEDLQPTINNLFHEPSTANSESTVTIYANVTDDNIVESVVLLWKDNSEHSKTMSLQGDNIYTADIGPFEEKTAVYYWVNATDNISQSTISSKNLFTIVDTSGPLITIVMPPAGSTIYNSTPTIKAYYSDPSGINKDSINLTIDENIVTPQIITSEVMVYTSSVEMSYNSHSVNLTVSDLLGNSETQEWFFIIDEYESISEQDLKNVVCKEEKEIIPDNFENIGINSVKLTTSSNFTDVKLTMAKLKDKPGEITTIPTDKILYAYLYLELTTNDTYIHDEDLDYLIINFKVTKQWINNNIEKKNVTLMEYHNNEWQTLTTSYLDEDDNYVYYEATVTEASILAIVGGEITESLGVSNGTPVEGLPWFIIIGAVIVGIILLIVVLLKTGYLYFEKK